MESMFIAFIILLLVIYYLGLGVWVFAGLLLVSTTGLVFLIDMPLDRIGKIMAPLVIRSATSWEISAIPMFIWMGELMLRTDMSDRLFRGLSPLTYHLPGRLLHTNIAGSALFAAISGSSAATTATVGKITISELGKRGYSKSLTYGSLAGAGSLGLLIPPSIVMIVYGVLAEVSIARLFAAGVFPGVMIAALYSGYVIIISVLNSSVAPPDRFAYGTSKAAVIGMTKSIALDYASRNIRCNAICPSAVETPSMSQRIEAMDDPVTARAAFESRQPIGRMASPAEIAEMAVYLASDLSGTVTGSVMIMDGGAKL